jgi:rhodanese-related sulfurtransferase
MKTKTILLALALLVCGAASVVRAQGEGQDLPRITLDEFKEKFARNEIVVLDVRNGDITAKIKGAAHIQETDLQSRLKDLPRDREIITYCA